MSKPEKIIRDAVHGYIHIDADYCEKIIDTPNFQRLKRLEQTNTRPVYPCAHHDRFIHSLGTYHLGRTAFYSIRENSENELKGKNLHLNWDSLKKSFELACLLHDVGHAPFSHTFEKYYKLEGIGSNSTIQEKLFDDNFIHSENNWGEKELFKKEYKNYPLEVAKPHEIVSALLVLTEYYEVLCNNFFVNPFLIARMILGLTYKEGEDITQERKFYNCFIELLNGKTIDVDKLDYLTRDQWATGHVSRVLDYERLFSSMYIKFESNNFYVCFHKRAINEILSLNEIKKIIGVSMHSHPIVKYDEYVLRHAIEEIAYLIDNTERQDKTVGKIISYSTLKKDEFIEVGRFKFSLVTDDDLIYLLKRHIDESPYAKEWFYRDYKLKALWKTFADYKYFFKDFFDEKDPDIEQQKQNEQQKRKLLSTYRKTIVDKYFERIDPNKEKNYHYHVEDILETEYELQIPDINIFIKDKIVKLNTLRDKYEKERESEKEQQQKTYFLLYFPKDLLAKREEFIEFAKAEVEVLFKQNK